MIYHSYYRRTNILAMLIGLIILAFIADTGVSAQSLKCFILTPPEQLLDSVQRIAITDFTVTSSYHADDPPSKAKKKDWEKVLDVVSKAADKDKKSQRFLDSGEKMANLMISALLEEDRGIRDVGSGFLGLGRKEGKSFQEGARTNVFEIVERSQIAQVMQELQLSQTGVIDEAQAAQVGKMLGVDAIITGTVTVSCEDRWIKENRKDKKKGDYVVDCNKRAASAFTIIRIIKVETGQVIGSKQALKKEELKKCEGEYGNDLPTPETTVDKCLQVVAGELVNYFAPCFELQKLEFAKIDGNEYKRFSESAKDALDQYNLDNAYLQYAAIIEQDPYNHSALFNVGVLEEAVGNYNLALEKYTMAAKLKSKEDKYTKAQNRVSNQVGFWEKLNALGIYIQERKFEISSDQVQAATIAKIQVNGSGSTRVDVKAAPDPGSETLVKVPGEVELELIETVGDWYKVRLLDEREGYIMKKEAKLLK
jgi:tetratricopeptide (TPR) repeat protein